MIDNDQFNLSLKVFIKISFAFLIFKKLIYIKTYFLKSIFIVKKLKNILKENQKKINNNLI